MLYNGIWLSNGQLALATLSGGVLMLDKTSHVVQRLTRANGLANNTVHSLFEDRQGGLWVTSNVGVSRISIDSPISSFDENNELTGTVLAVTRYQGRLYVTRCTHSEGGRRLAERRRAMVAAHPFDPGNGVLIHRTCSIGLANYPFFPAAPDALTWEQVVNMADECMYSAKRRGAQ